MTPVLLMNICGLPPPYLQMFAYSEYVKVSLIDSSLLPSISDRVDSEIARWKSEMNQGRLCREV
jgi:hypothetical protein